MEKHYSIHDTSKLLSVHRKTVENWIKAGKIKAVNISSPDKPRYRIPESEIQRVTRV